MKGTLKTFERYETKYLLTKTQYEGFIKDYGCMLTPDDYPESLIQNVYYDTPNYRLIRESIEKPVYKEKLRLRAYNEIDETGTAFLEVKKKYEGIVYKRRETMNLKTARKMVEEKAAVSENDSQIKKELAWFVKFYGRLVPAMYLSYNRVAKVHKEDPDIRITFDRDITFRNKDVNLTSGSYGRKLLPEGSVLMEIKVPGYLPIDMVRVMEKYRIYPTSFSKYGEAYKIVSGLHVGYAM
ncbi:MAG: polyphosphate polymerase domain-containing protein [Lachnospiraceae bacterium]|nr:polyphosphate polymerase domain-containing protein [Lachnospiraceae bacterium]